MDTVQGMRIDPSNVEQARAWDGTDGSYWAANAQRFDQAVAVHHRALLEHARIAPTDHVLDVGCGTGQTSRDAARAATSGAVLGVDLSSEMILLARQLATQERIANVQFEQADAQVFPFTPQAFDIAISRTAMMFFGDPVAAFRNIATALRPTGRLASLVWQQRPRNEWFGAFATALAGDRGLPELPPDAPTPFSLSEPDRVGAMLSDAGFADVHFTGLTAPMYFGPDANSAYQFLLGSLGWMLEPLDDSGRARARDALRATLEAHQTSRGVSYESAAWIITAQKA